MPAPAAATWFGEKDRRAKSADCRGDVVGENARVVSGGEDW